MAVGLAGAGVVGRCNPEGSNYQQFWGAAGNGSWLGVETGEGGGAGEQGGRGVGLGLWCAGVGPCSLWGEEVRRTAGGGRTGPSNICKTPARPPARPTITTPQVRATASSRTAAASSTPPQTCCVGAARRGGRRWLSSPPPRCWRGCGSSWRGRCGMGRGGGEGCWACCACGCQAMQSS